MENLKVIFKPRELVITYNNDICDINNDYIRHIGVLNYDLVYMFDDICFKFLKIDDRGITLEGLLSGYDSSINRLLRAIPGAIDNYIKIENCLDSFYNRGTKI